MTQIDTNELRKMANCTPFITPEAGAGETADALRNAADEIDRLRAENYYELIAQMDEAWDYAPGRRLDISWNELHAFIESRMAHTPAGTLRQRLAALESSHAELVEAAQCALIYYESCALNTSSTARKLRTALANAAKLKGGSDA